MYGALLCAHPVRGESHNQQNTTREVATTSLPFLRRTALIACSLCKGRTRHELHILVAAPFCCDWKSRVACAQSFALWQQATIEITRRDHSIACSRHIHIFLFFAHILFVVNHTINTTPQASYYMLGHLLWWNKLISTNSYYTARCLVLQCCVNMVQRPEPGVGHNSCGHFFSGPL